MQKYDLLITNRLLKLSFLTMVFFTINCVLPQQTYAQASANTPENHERWYQVEMMIFSRSEHNAKEAWPKDIKLTYPDNLVFLKPTDSNNSEGFNTLPASERKLNSQAATIAKSGSYTLLFHQAWRQMIYAKNTHIFIGAGKTFNGHQELEGSVGLSVGQFLKFQSNLWLTQFAPRYTTNDAISTPASTSATAITTSATNSTEEEKSWPELPALPHATLSESDQPLDYVTKRIVKISQQRSMRSIEVHYIDHPLLGIIIKIVPIKLGSQ